MTATITVTAALTGWDIEATGTGSPYPFLASLPACPSAEGHTGQKPRAACPTGYHRSHVERLVTAVAKSYGKSTPVPEVPTLPGR